MNLSEDEMEVENCSSCNESMNVSALAPFTEVQCPNCGVSSRVKCQLGKYHMLRKQGLGGMSVVFEAEDRTLERKVAIKLLNEDFSKDEKRIKEFEREAKITAAISHPNVVRVYTVGKEFGRHYIAMEFVEGDSLEQWINQQRALGEEMVAELAIEIVKGLKAAHEAGLIHRDMKPGNILIDSQGRAKIVDFGLALMTSGGKVTAEEIWATPYYVSPEALKLKEEDLRSDIYALGSSLYHVLSGKAPFDTETRSTSELIRLKSQIPKLSVVAENVSPYLCRVIEKMMAHELDGRFQNYDALLQALSQVELHYRTGHEPDDLSLGTQNKSSSKPRDKTMRIALGIGFIVFVAAGLLIVSSERKSAPENIAAIPQAKQDPTTLDIENSEAERALIIVQLRNADHLFKQGRFKEAHRSYLELTMSEAVVSETAYWTGLRSAISAWLAGESPNARVALREILRKQRSEAEQMSKTCRKLQQSVSDLLQQEKTELAFQVSNDLDGMILFSTALQEWDQGRWGKAEELFKQLKQAHSEPDREALSYYQSLTDGYLSDLKTLDQFREEVVPQTMEEANALEAAVVKARSQLRTKGRAEKNVQQWQIQFSIRAIEIEDEAKRKEQDLQEIKLKRQAARRELREKVRSDFQTFKLENAYRRMKKITPISKEDQQWRDNVLFITKPVVDLYAMSFKLLENKSLNFVVKRRDGMAQYERVLGAKESGIFVETSSGEKLLVQWSKLSPDTMLNLHEKRSVSHLSEEEKYSQQKQLICYSWLMGLESKAEPWAKKLALDDPEFSKSWKNYRRFQDQWMD